MVVICLPMAAATGVEHERIATPSMWIVQAPHCAMPHPYLVPVRPTFSRNAHKSGISGLAFFSSRSIVLQEASLTDVIDCARAIGIAIKAAREADHSLSLF